MDIPSYDRSADPAMMLLLGDDLPLLVHGLSLQLESAGFVVRKASTPEGVLAEIGSCPPDALLLGFFAGGVTAPCFQLLMAIREHAPALPVLVIAPVDDVHLELAARNLGARGFLTMATAPRELYTGVQAVLGGQSCFRPLPSPRSVLTPRQLEVLQAAVRSGSHKVAGNDLGLSLRTVEHHLAKARKRLGIKYTHILIPTALERRLLSIPPSALAMSGRTDGKWQRAGQAGKRGSETRV